jgi:hypothetical protein
MWLTALIACVALVGLVSGVLTRNFLSSQSTQTEGRNQRPSATPTMRQGPLSTPTATAAATVAPALVHFSIKLTVTPNAGQSGGAITITALATDDKTGESVPGLTCRLRTPTDGESGLLSTWPTPTATNSDGIATWIATVPNESPGRYAIEVYAQTPAWKYIGRASFTITTA